MEGMIDSDGCLYMTRGGSIFTAQLCPFGDHYCGYSCPLFGTPIMVPKEPSGNEIMLRLCHTTLFFTKFTNHMGSE